MGIGWDDIQTAQILHPNYTYSLALAHTLSSCLAVEEKRAGLAECANSTPRADQWNCCHSRSQRQLWPHDGCLFWCRSMSHSCREDRGESDKKCEILFSLLPRSVNVGVDLDNWITSVCSLGGSRVTQSCRYQGVEFTHSARPYFSSAPMQRRQSRS